MKLLKKYWVMIALSVLFLVLFACNYDPGTFLSGWDNLHSEFNPSANLRRALQAPWQEYQGLGLLGGMAHSADLFRQLLFLPLMFLFPTSLFRYLWHFLMMLIGVFGAYFLISYFLGQFSQAKKEKMSQFLLQLTAFLGASFYLLNFATVQNFYSTFEPFAAFYAFFPWLVYLLILTLEADLKKKEKLFRRNLFFFSLISLLATSAFYVQSLAVVYLIFVVLILFFYWLRSRKIRAFLITLLIFALNAFWFLSAFHFILGGAELIKNSKIKAMSNEILLSKNQAYGDFKHLAKMQGFWLGQMDFDQAGNSVYLMDAYKTHFSYLGVNFLAWGFFALVIFALFYLFSKKHRHRWFLLGSFLISWLMLAGENFPFKFLNQILFALLPLFKEMFRITFTKWVVPFSLFYSILLSIGLFSIFNLIKNKLWQLIVASVFFFSLILYALPSFQGNFFYSRLRVKIPEAYFQLFDYFKTEAPANSRIANFPQHSFNGWQWHDWGYRGSGFIWYGIEQPILDRAFDVWSSDLENYYWQLQTALDRQDIKQLEAVLSKYDVDYLLLDESLVNRNTQKPFDYSRWEAFFSESDKIQPVETFNFIKLYQFSDSENENEQDFVSLYDALPQISNQHQFLWQDQAYLDGGDYLSVEVKNAVSIYPFASLFSNHSQAELEFDLRQDSDNFYLYSNASLDNLDLADFSLQFQSYLLTEKYLPAQLTWQTKGAETIFQLEALLPTIQVAEQSISWTLKKELRLESKSCSANNCLLVLNNQVLGDFSPAGEQNVLLRSQLRNTLSFQPSEEPEYYDYQFLDLSEADLQIKYQSLTEASDLTVIIPKFKTAELGQNLLAGELNQVAAKNCRALSSDSFYKERRSEGNYYASVDANSCDSFYLSALDHAQGYLIELKSQNWQALPLLFALQVPSLGRSPIETYLPADSSSQTSYFFLPPTEQFNAGYTLYLATDSYGREMNENILESLMLYQWPYNFVKNLQLLRNEQTVPSATLSSCDFSAKKRALFLYQVDLRDDCQSARYLKLSQAYTPDWLGLVKCGEGLFDYQVLSHAKFNAWANAWEFNDVAPNQRIYLFFWPQLLEYLGFILLAISAAYFLWPRKK